MSVIADIRNGKHDEELRFITEAVEARQAEVAAQTAATLRPGDTVRLHGLRPKSINGLEVSVIQVNRTRVVVDIPNRGRSTVPQQCIEKVQA